MRTKYKEGEEYLRTFKIILVLIFAMLFGLYKGCEDISYMTSGKETTANFVKFSKISGSKGRESNNKNMVFSFTDSEGKQCTGYERVDLYTEAPFDGKLDIVYLQGKMLPSGRHTVARLKGTSSWSGILIFLISGLILAVVLFTSYSGIKNEVQI